MIVIQRLVLMLVFLIVGACSLTPVDSRIPGYLTTPRGQLLLSQEGRCWRTAEWRPALAVPQCDPDVVRAREAEKEVEEEAKEEKKKNQDEGEHPALEASPFVAPVTTKYREEIEFAPLVLNSDASFRFGDDRLTPEGKDAVIELAGLIKARKVQDMRISIIGHTDRIGNEKDNRVLSKRRAESVKAAFVAEGLKPEWIQTAGMGSAKPVTQAGDCPDNLVKCELIDCLRPDRRVEITLRGKMESGRRLVPLSTDSAVPQADGEPASHSTTSPTATPTTPPAPSPRIPSPDEAALTPLQKNVLEHEPPQEQLPVSWRWQSTKGPLSKTPRDEVCRA